MIVELVVSKDQYYDDGLDDLINILVVDVFVNGKEIATVIDCIAIEEKLTSKEFAALVSILLNWFKGIPFCSTSVQVESIKTSKYCLDWEKNGALKITRC